MHILRLSSVGSTFVKFLMSFFKAQVSSQILHHSSVQWHISPLYFFGSSIIYFLQKEHIKVQVFRLATHQIHHVIFGIKSHVFFKLCITLQFHETWLLCTFSSKILYDLEKRGPLKCANFKPFDYSHDNYPNSLSFFKPQVGFPLNFASLFNVMTHSSYEFF